MPQLLPLSRAARLVGISRGALQKRIQDNELQTFEGAVRVSDLLRVFPDIKLQDDSAVERARHFRESAIPKTEDDAALPAPEVLAHRLSSVSGDLTTARHELAHYSSLVHELRKQLVALDDGRLAETVAWLDAKLGALPNVPERKAELMAQNDADEVIFKMKNDPRVTRVGRVIRKASIDEIPQLFNVLKGEMSLVGPRPPVPYEVAQYQFDQLRRLDAVPGITGLQQVSGRSELSFKRWVELDLQYISEQSLLKDIEILLKTIPAVLTGRGAY